MLPILIEETEKIIQANGIKKAYLIKSVEIMDRETLYIYFNHLPSKLALSSLEIVLKNQKASPSLIEEGIFLKYNVSASPAGDALIIKEDLIPAARTLAENLHFISKKTFGEIKNYIETLDNKQVEAAKSATSTLSQNDNSIGNYNTTDMGVKRKSLEMG